MCAIMAGALVLPVIFVFFLDWRLFDLVGAPAVHIQDMRTCVQQTAQRLGRVHCVCSDSHVACCGSGAQASDCALQVAEQLAGEGEATLLNQQATGSAYCSPFSFGSWTLYSMFIQAASGWDLGSSLRQSLPPSVKVFWLAVQVQVTV
ncbi:hypothetical protein COO60DRAFT_1505889 [Scenedesmus sp. NREL 46B-D3]|nr:hypothetical protein COO60DRAFT_1505889 [Scenedesmus sp. NREL 46B-D3]